MFPLALQPRLREKLQGRVVGEGTVAVGLLLSCRLHFHVRHARDR